MYQSVGSENIEKIAQCLDKPLFRRYISFFISSKLLFREITGKPIVLDLKYTGDADAKKEDEVEDLYLLLKEVKVSKTKMQSSY